MGELNHVLGKLLLKQDLSEQETYDIFLRFSQSDAIPPTQVASFLTALSLKGESAAELVGAAKAILQAALSFPRPEGLVLDIVGTGGDGKQTINISTLAALTAAACGIPVAKHGNRSVSSKCGSADVLEALGMSLDAAPQQSALQLKSAGFTFLFAPLYHSSFKHIGEIRKQLGFRTIFNLAGPLTNPARPSVMLLGVANPNWLHPVATALTALGCEKAWVVHGGGGSDELDLEKENYVISIEQESTKEFTVTAEEAGLKQAHLAAAKGGSKEENAVLCKQILQGQEGPHHDMVALNAGAALFLCGHGRNLREGAMLAKETLKKGQPWRIMEKIREHG